MVILNSSVSTWLRQYCLLFIISGFMASGVSAQGDCGTDAIRIAKNEFDIGKFQNVFGILFPCINEGFSDAEKLQAYRLLAMSYLALDDNSNATLMVKKLCAINSDYQGEIFDSPAFISLIAEVRLGISATISIGTRSQGNKQTDSPVPVDIITAEQLALSPHMELGQLLQYLVPTFSANHQAITDGTDHIDPASIRGLGPDQVLILINGKRRHTCSIVNLLGSFGKGSVNTDFNAIPVMMIERIEILRDGAAAQYGSDAIAGVVNIVLKKTEGIQVNSASGITHTGDGLKLRFDLNYGIKIGENGFLTVSSEIFSRGATDRSGLYTGTIYHADPKADSADPRTQNFNRDVMNIGDAYAFTPKLYFNTRVPLDDKSGFYGFGGVSYREGRANGYYRFPKSEERIVSEYYPDGFLPEIRPRILDKSLCTGIYRQIGKYKLDFSNTFGKNSFDFFVTNSNNASMGTASPTQFYSGGFSFSQNTTNLDVSRKFQPRKLLQSLNLAFGSEFRFESYHILPGDEASWVYGGDTTSSGEPKVPGAQVFPGFHPEDKTDAKRYSNSVYLDFEADVNKKLLIDLAGRFERYSDFGGTLNGKLAGRYKITPMLMLRGGGSTGFRAPSLQQLFLTNTSTQITNGQLIQVQLFNNESRVTRQFGIPKLKEERSINFSSGITLEPLEHLLFTADVYHIDIKDRIVLSGFFSDADSQVAVILEPFGVTSAQFFANAVNTRTKGIDLLGSYDFTFKEKAKLKFSIAGNISSTRIKGNIKVSEQLKGKEETLFSREEQARLQYYQPGQKWIFSGNFSFSNWEFMLNFIRFGEVRYLHPTDKSADEVFSPKWVTDLVLSYRAGKNLRLSIGGTNIFNVLPDQNKSPVNINEGRFLYSNVVTQYGANGAFYYAKVELFFK